MSFWRTYYHLVWATKNRAPIIAPELEPRLFGYIVTKAAELGVYVYAINGWSDHLHLVVAIPPKRSVSEVVKMLKGASSHYVNERRLTEGAFAWQEGYGVFTLGEKQRAAAVTYVQNQKAHHRDKSANTWLERTERVDEGPTEPTASPFEDPGRLREPTGVYAVNDDLPF